MYLLTIKDVSKILKVNVSFVYDLIKKGHLQALKLGSMKITNVELDRFILSASGSDFTDLDNVIPLQNKK